MIWVWILLAVATTALLLKGKKIEPYNFVWALIPIDKYGITLLDFTFKPVYIFSFLIIAYYAVKKKLTLRLSTPMFISTFFIAILIITTTLFQGEQSIGADIKLYAMFFLTVICSIGLMSMLGSIDDVRQIKDVIIATAVGYGLVFIALNTLDSMGMTLPAVKSYALFDDSIIRVFRSAKGGVLIESQRLRGFYVDANASSVPFIVGIAALLGEIVKEGYSFKRLIYALVISANIIMTSSRTALIILIVVTIISVFRFFFAKVRSRQKIVFIGFILAGLFAVTLVLIYNQNLLDRIYESVLSTYFNRSGLTDDAGRFSIWKSALSSLNSSNWFYGVGSEGLYSATNNYDAHNTFIQATCTNGVIFGLYYTLYFIYPLINIMKYRFVYKHKTALLSTIAIVYFMILLSSSTVSHICSVYMIYTAFLLIATPELLNNDNGNTTEQLSLRG